MHNCWRESINATSPATQGARRCVTRKKESATVTGARVVLLPAAQVEPSACWWEVSTIRQLALSTACGQRAAEVEEM